MTTRKILYNMVFTLFILSCWGKLWGQVSDFQSWWEFKLDRSLGKSWQVRGELEQRFKNNSQQYNRSLITLGAEYDAIRWLNLGGAARMALVADKEGLVHPKFRIHTDATGRYKAAGLTLGLRSRLQYGFQDFLLFNQLKENSLVYRTRLKAQYHFFGSKFRSFVSLESWYYISELPDKAFRNMRYAAGLSYSLNVSSRFSLRYIFEDEFHVRNPDKLHVLVAGYSYSL